MTAFLGTIVIAGAAPQQCVLQGELINPPPVASQPPFPSPPIAPGGQPPVAGWPGGGPGGAYPDQSLPGGRPPGTWGGEAPPYPDTAPPATKPPGMDNAEWIYTRKGWALLPPHASNAPPSGQPPHAENQPSGGPGAGPKR